MSSTLTEVTPDVSELSDTITRLHTNLETLQRELHQASSVWQTTLAEEKQDLQQLLQDKQKVWESDDVQWQKQCEAYEQKIQALESFFQEQLTQVERNAVRALNDLDDAWQREKLQWEKMSRLRLQETESRAEAATVSSMELLRQDLQRLWENDKTRWEQTLQQSLQQLHEQQKAWNTEQIRHQEQLAVLKKQLAQARVQALENQVAVLETFFHSHARR